MIKEFIETIRLRLHGIELLEVDENVIQIFRKYVKGHKSDSDLTIKKYITRDWILSEDTSYEVMNHYSQPHIIETRQYGNLVIKCKKTEYESRVISIYNRKGKKLDFNIDEKLKAKLNKIMRL